MIVRAVLVVLVIVFGHAQETMGLGPRDYNAPAPSQLSSTATARIQPRNERILAITVFQTIGAPAEAG